MPRNLPTLDLPALRPDSTAYGAPPYNVANTSAGQAAPRTSRRTPSTRASSAPPAAPRSPQRPSPGSPPAKPPSPPHDTPGTSSTAHPASAAPPETPPEASTRRNDKHAFRPTTPVHCGERDPRFPRFSSLPPCLGWMWWTLSFSVVPQTRQWWPSLARTAARVRSHWLVLSSGLEAVFLQARQAAAAPGCFAPLRARW